MAVSLDPRTEAPVAKKHNFNTKVPSIHFEAEVSKCWVRADMMNPRTLKVNGLKPKPWTLWMKPLSKLGQFKG